MKNFLYKTKYSNLSINTIRMLGVEAISRANSGHPGIVLGAAPIMYTLFRNHLNINPKNPNFFNRDRFVLSAGHGSALLYATMLVSGYNSINMMDLINFRKINSKTPGHPENIALPGVEVSTGPLGQGVAMAVGLAIAEAKLANQFNNFSKLINHHTYCLFGDGCMEEGIFYEAISLAGKLKLNKLILLYDSNKIQLDGKVSDSTCTNVRKLFKSVDWNYIKVKNVNNLKMLDLAILKAKRSLKPTIIECNSTIGYGCRLQNTNQCHGNPLTTEQIKELRAFLNYKVPSFTIHPNVTSDFEVLEKRGKKAEQKFNFGLNVLESKNLKLYENFLKVFVNKFNFSIDWFKTFEPIKKNATRVLFADVLQQYLENNPTILTLNCDLSSSTKITNKKSLPFSSKYLDGQNINIGVREFAMAAISNGISAHGGCKATGSTFLSFSDYCKAAIRLGAISHLPSVNIFSHDSISVGEDGPTHQPIEQIQTLRSIPNHLLFRPANFEECLACLYHINETKNKPISVITSRREFDQFAGSFIGGQKGAYIIKDSEQKHNLNLIATGSEVAVAVEVSKLLAKKDILARVISMPCVELFLEQKQEYQNSILDDKPTISIEYGSTSSWYRFADLAIGIDEFGKSGKPDDVIEYFKLNPKSINDKIIQWLSNNQNKGK